MKKHCLILLLLLTANTIFSQKIAETDKRFYFFKIWNFTKYYHPDLASGKINADTLFFKNLAVIDAIQDKDAYNSFIQDYIDKLQIPKNKKVKRDNSKKMIMQNLDQKWFSSNKLFTSASRKKLAALFDHRYIETHHHYIPDLSYNPEIPNEPVYKFPDTANLPYEMRMLAIAKLQGATDYLFPHKYLTDKNMDTIIKQNIKLFAACTTRTQYEKLLLKVTSCFNDTHSYRFFNQMKTKSKIFHNTFFPPFDYKVFENEIVVTDLIIPERCKQDDIQTGDIITAINKQPVHQLIDSLSSLLSTSNKNALVHRLSNYINNLAWQSESGNFSLDIRRGTTSTTKNTSFVHTGDLENVKKIIAYLNRDTSPAENGLSLADNKIAYFKADKTQQFLDIDEEHVDKTMDSILSITAKQKGIIFDMRAYPDWGGFIQYYVLKRFGKTPFRFADYYEINKQELGTYIIKDEIDTYHRKELVVDNPPYKGKVVIIVNSETLSISEFFTMLLQQLFPQSITIGEPSAGADGDEKTINLPGNYEFHFTGNAIFYTDNTHAQRKGVKINIPLQLSPEDATSKQDKLLNAAIKIIND